MEEALFRPLTPAEKELEEAMALVQARAVRGGARLLSLAELRRKLSAASPPRLRRCRSSELSTRIVLLDSCPVLRSLKELREKIELAAGAHAAYQSLNECGTAQLGQYNYKICPFGEATQGHAPRQVCCKSAASICKHLTQFYHPRGPAGPLEGLGERRPARRPFRRRRALLLGHRALASGAVRVSPGSISLFDLHVANRVCRCVGT